MGSFSSSSRKEPESYTRRAHHAGSWYTSSASELDSMLTTFLEDAHAAASSDLSTPATCQNMTQPPSSSDNGNGTNEFLSWSEMMPRSVVVPHAGFSYSGPTAAHAYLALREAVIMGGVSRIVVLHPSHHIRLDGCAVSGASTLENPLRNLPVDEELRQELLATGHFQTMDRHVDEQEHSGEMQYPFIAKVLLDASSSSSYSNGNLAHKNVDSITVLPIMVGGISVSQEAFYGRLLAPILAKDGTFTVISSDFCHWGSRFGYSPPRDRDYRNLGGGRVADLAMEEIYEYIEQLDRMGMDHIQMQNPGAFAEYLKRSKNTICGRHPIAVWLNATKVNKENGTENVEIKFVQYAQSSQVKSTRDSSVSYASAIARKTENTNLPN